MKVYVVTSGCYSDYRIRRVFSNKEKAEKYAKGVREANDVGEYELDDDKEIELYTQAWIDYRIDTGIFEFVSLNQVNSLDVTFDEANKAYYFSYGNTRPSLALKRAILKLDLTADEKEEYINKYKKVIYDLVAQIKYLKTHDGFNEKQINEWLKNK